MDFYPNGGGLQPGCVLDTNDVEWLIGSDDADEYLGKYGVGIGRRYAIKCDAHQIPNTLPPRKFTTFNGECNPQNYAVLLPILQVFFAILTSVCSF